MLPTNHSDMTCNDDKIHDECGVFAVINNHDAAINASLGLHALQHRGQEACGIGVFNDNKDLIVKRFKGLVSDNLNSKEVLDQLSGNIAIGHVRYSTAGNKDDSNNFQPLFAEFSFGHLAIAHNGNITNAVQLRKKLIKDGAIFISSMDSEVIIHLIARSKKANTEEKIIDAFNQITGAFSVVIMLKNKIIALKDPHGVRPLALGILEGKEKNQDAYIISSETCGFDIIEAKYIREIQAGEFLTFTLNDDLNNNLEKNNNQLKLKSIFPFVKKKKKPCVFEYIYFSRPDSIIDNLNIYQVRKNIGISLAHQYNITADLIVPIPDSGVPAAIGYAKQSGIELDLGIIRNHYVGRTFIEPSNQIRHFGVKLKHNANKSVIENKNIILIDDSLVRGTTSKKIVKMLREAGAKKIYMLIASPRIISPCYYGIDTPKKEELIASRMNDIELANFINVDKIGFLSMKYLYQSIIKQDRNEDEPQFCEACFTLKYPISIN